MPVLEVPAGPALHSTPSAAGQLGAAPSGHQRSTLMSEPASIDLEYQQWRSEQLRKLEQRYPQWQQNSYKDFAESFPHSCRTPAIAAVRSGRPASARRAVTSAK